MSDGGIRGGKYRHRHPPFSIVDDVFDCGCGGAPSSSDRGRRCRGLVVSLPPSLSCGGALLDPDGNNDKDDDDVEDDDDYEDDDDRSHQDRMTGMWALRRRTSTITRTTMHQRLQAGLRQRRQHQRQRGGGGRRNDGGTTRRPIPKATNHAPRLSLPLMPRKPRRHRRCCRRDRGRRRRRLTDGMEEDAARREDDNKDDKGRSKKSGGRICRPGQKTGGSVGRRCVCRRATATTAAAGGRGGGALDDGAEVVGVSSVLSSMTKSTDCWIGGSWGANLHRRHWQALASRPSSSVVASSGRRQLRAML